MPYNKRFNKDTQPRYRAAGRLLSAALRDLQEQTTFVDVSKKMKRIVFNFLPYILLTLSIVVGCHRENPENSSEKLFKHPKSVHPDVDTSEFGKIYSEVRKRPKNKYADILLKFGEINLEIIENAEAYRIIRTGGPSDSVGEIISLYKSGNEIELNIYYPYLYEKNGSDCFKKKYSISTREFEEFNVLMEKIKVRNFESKLTLKDYAKAIHPSGCYIEGVKNGKYFDAYESLLEGNTLGKICEFWNQYGIQFKAQSRNNRLQGTP